MSISRTTLVLAMMVVTMMMNRSQNKFIVSILIFIFLLADQKAPIMGIKEAMDQKREGQASAQEVQHPREECRDPGDRE